MVNWSQDSRDRPILSNRFLPLPILTDSLILNLADTDTDYADTILRDTNTDYSVSESVKIIGKTEYRSIPKSQSLS